MHKESSLLSVIVDRNQVFTLRNLLNDRSAVRVVAGMERPIQIAVNIDG
jgi:hypothetical protein